MEHLLCLSPDDLVAFIKVTEMKVITSTPQIVIIKGESIFTYVYDYAKQMYCFQKGTSS